MNIPAITAEQMREVDRLMIDVYGIALIQMMENAGRNLAALARQHFFAGNPVGKDVLVLVGSGGNGGGGLAAARRLHNWGAHVKVYTTKLPEEIEGVPSHQLTILNKIGLQVSFAGEYSELPESDLILDAIIGYGLQSAPQGQAGKLIQMANNSGVPILSLDAPSGIDSTNGHAYDPHIRATATLTLALPKFGLLAKTVKNSVGVLYLGDISVPPQLYENLGLHVSPIFAERDIIRI